MLLKSVRRACATPASTSDEQLRDTLAQMKAQRHGGGGGGGGSKGRMNCGGALRDARREARRHCASTVARHGGGIAPCCSGCTPRWRQWGGVRSCGGRTLGTPRRANAVVAPRLNFTSLPMEPGRRRRGVSRDQSLKGADVVWEGLARV